MSSSVGDPVLDFAYLTRPQMFQVEGYDITHLWLNWLCPLCLLIDNRPRGGYSPVRGPFRVHSGARSRRFQLERSCHSYLVLPFDPKRLTHATCAVIPGKHTDLLGQPQYDWGFSTVSPLNLIHARCNFGQVPQANANGRPIYLARYAKLTRTMSPRTLIVT